MTYATLLNNETLKSNFLAILKPRRIHSTWSLVSGTKYSGSFTHGQIVGVDDDGAALTEASSSALSDGQWYYDVTTNTLYIDIGSNPSGSIIVCTYEIYISTYDAQWYRVPTDNTTRVVYFEPIITKSPEVLSSASDNLFGFLPTQSTSLTCTNAPHVLEKHLYDSSFNQADIKFYHWLDKLTVSNVKLYGEWVISDISYDKQNVTFSLLDKLSIFDKEYRHTNGDQFYTVSRFSALDPYYINRPIRAVYGVVDGFVPVNIDYVIDSPTTSDNRRWMCIHGAAADFGNVATTVPASPACTTTRTYVNDADGIRVGDSVYIWRTGLTYYDFVIVTSVNKTGSHYIEHAAISIAASSGDNVERFFVGKLDIVKNDIVYHAMYARDYAIDYDLTAKTLGFVFQTSLESNLGMPSNLTPFDKVYCRIYGIKNSGYDETETNNYCRGVYILRDSLTSVVGSSNVDLTEFTSVAASVTDLVGIAIPDRSGKQFPTYKELITQLVQTLLLKIFIDDNNKWTIKVTGPVGSTVKSIDSTEIIDGSFMYDLSYKDIYSVVNVEYSDREIGEKGTLENNFSITTYESNTAKYIHKIDRQKSFKSLHFLSSEAQTLANRLGYYFGDRLGKIKFGAKHRFFNSELGDTITLSRDNLPGELASIDGAIISIDKSLREINIELDDQKGIEDNSGSW